MQLRAFSLDSLQRFSVDSNRKKCRLVPAFCQNPFIFQLNRPPPCLSTAVQLTTITPFSELKYESAHSLFQLQFLRGFQNLPSAIVQLQQFSTCSKILSDTAAIQFHKLPLWSVTPPVKLQNHTDSQFLHSTEGSTRVILTSPTISTSWRNLANSSQILFRATTPECYRECCPANKTEETTPLPSSNILQEEAVARSLSADTFHLLGDTSSILPTLPHPRRLAPLMKL